MIRKCDICGLEADDHWVMSYDVGRRTMWLCWECYKNSQYEANKSDKHRQQKLYKIKKQKERSK